MDGGGGGEEEHKTLKILGFGRKQKELEFRKRASELGFGRSHGEEGSRTKDAATIANRMEGTKRLGGGKGTADGLEEGKSPDLTDGEMPSPLAFSFYEIRATDHDMCSKFLKKFKRSWAANGLDASLQDGTLVFGPLLPYHPKKAEKKRAEAWVGSGLLHALSLSGMPGPTMRRSTQTPNPFLHALASPSEFRPLFFPPSRPRRPRKERRR